MKRLQSYQKIDHLRSINIALGELYSHLDNEQESKEIEGAIETLELFFEEYRLSPVLLTDQDVATIVATITGGTEE
jgi:hypothetical protein